jgi:pyruvate,water dikinase
MTLPALPHVADPATSDLTWEWDDEHSPVPKFPLLGDAVEMVWTGGSQYRALWLDIPYVVEYRVVDGYAYFTEHFLDPDRDMVIERVKQAKVAQAHRAAEYWDREVWPAFSETYRWMRAMHIERVPLTDVAADWDAYWRRSPRLMGLHYMIATVVYQVLEDLLDLYVSLFGPASSTEAMSLVQGSSDDLHRVSRDLYDLAESARQSLTVTNLILADPHLALWRMNEAAEGRAFLERFDVFLEAHGHMGQMSIDLTDPSWEDEPDRLIIEIRKQLLERGDDPRQRQARIIAEADAVADQARARLGDNDLERFESALALARAVAPFKEGHNYWLDRMWQAHAHRFVMQVGRRLAAEEIIAELRDVVFLHIEEVGDVLRTHHDLRQVVAERKAEYAQWEAITPPRYLGRTPETAADVGDGAGDDTRVLRGVGASIGTVTGTARIVVSADDFERVQPGDVLVCTAPNPSWVALYAIVSALVTDTGGLLSHAAVVAREFGVPAVVGTGNATRRIRDGQEVEVDGAAGVVRLL